MVMGHCMTASGQGECNIKLLKGITVKGWEVGGGGEEESFHYTVLWA